MMREHKPRVGGDINRIGMALRRANTIGDLERLAGIPSTEAARWEFWRVYAHLPGYEGLDAGVAELERRIIVGEGTEPDAPSAPSSPCVAQPDPAARAGLE